MHRSSESRVAQVAEISISGSGRLRVHRVVCAIDCGTVVNPNIVAAQMEGSVAFALSAVMKGAITIREGRVEQSNFHDYPILRMDEMPEVETHIVSSHEPPAGVGEPGVPPVIPAVMNAVFAATHRRVRRLPIEPGDLLGSQYIFLFYSASVERNIFPLGLNIVSRIGKMQLGGALRLPNDKDCMLTMNSTERMP